ncbi:NAD-dependent epimerase/dehydratase family protein [Microlunatus speluncae]|uniref:NAD-dependent epimerase/dehydratase family protein n=1 Tax=Microlunatus speluncae TaxID=2594267 RepID=UPI001266427A|nr:NAD(P)-dependent oxidoreductase [Microlunatus speluncae]
MRLLVIGGSGLVGSLIIPRLAQDHEVVVYDLHPPAEGPEVEFRSGSVEDFDGLRAAAAGVEAVVYLVMNPKRDWDSVGTAALAFDVNVKGLYLAWWAAAGAGVRHGVHASTLSVFEEPRDRYPDETVTPDSTGFYGFTKTLGEQVCRHAVEARGLTINSLRLCHPTPDQDWPPPGDSVQSMISTRGTDVATAFEAALHLRDGHQVITISGDAEERHTSLAKAARLLNWHPTPR